MTDIISNSTNIKKNFEIDGVDDGIKIYKCKNNDELETIHLSKLDLELLIQGLFAQPVSSKPLSTRLQDDFDVHISPQDIKQYQVATVNPFVNLTNSNKTKNSRKLKSNTTLKNSKKKSKNSKIDLENITNSLISDLVIEDKDEESKLEDEASSEIVPKLETDLELDSDISTYPKKSFDKTVTSLANYE